MSVNGDQPERKPLSGIEATHGPVVFQIRLFSDGHLDWKTPNGPEASMNEILFRGYFDKCREAILEAMRGGGRLIA